MPCNCTCPYCGKCINRHGKVLGKINGLPARQCPCGAIKVGRQWHPPEGKGK